MPGPPVTSHGWRSVAQGVEGVILACGYGPDRPGTPDRVPSPPLGCVLTGTRHRSRGTAANKGRGDSPVLDTAGGTGQSLHRQASY